MSLLQSFAANKETAKLHPFLFKGLNTGICN